MQRVREWQDIPSPWAVFLVTLHKFATRISPNMRLWTLQPKRHCQTQSRRSVAWEVVVLGAKVDVGSPQQGLTGEGLAQAGDCVVKSIRCPRRLRRVCGVRAPRVRMEEVGVGDVGHDGSGGVGDGPQGGQDMTVTDQLQRARQVERLIQQMEIAGGGLAGGQVGKVGLVKVECGKVGQGQRPIVQEEGAERGIGRVLDAVAG